MRTIQEGDTVFVYMANDIVRKVIVDNTPSDVGDLWYVRDEYGNMFAINPCSSEFIKFHKRVEVETE